MSTRRRFRWRRWKGVTSGDVRFYGTIKNTPVAIRSLLRKLGKGSGCIWPSGPAVRLHTPRGAVFDATARDGLVHVPVDPGLAAISDPEVWLKESFDAAQMFAYAEPVLSGTEPVELTRAYETAARTASRARAALAAQRLANLLNRAF